MRLRYIWTSCSEVMSRDRKAICNSGTEASTSWRLLGAPNGRCAGTDCAKRVMVTINISKSFFMANLLQVEVEAQRHKAHPKISCAFVLFVATCSRDHTPLWVRYS